ncbi:MAG: urease accessory protein UreD [Deltaproteobacteria bacterium]|nr:urease accessory protein UreD [Deltaproteobacteria bacterium]
MGAFGQGQGGWAASISATVGLRAGRSRLVGLGFQGPLRILRPFWPEGAVPGRAIPCHLCLLHPPGGLVAGDSLGQRLEVAEGAHCLATGPSATKVYRHREGARDSSIHSLALVGDGAVLEWLPQGTIVFDGARASMSLQARLAPRARALGCDLTVLGRPESGETFGSGCLRQLTWIWRRDAPVFRELLSLRGGDVLLGSPLGLGGFPVVALFWALGAEGDPADLGALGEACRVLNLRDDFGPVAWKAGGAPRSASLAGPVLLARALARSIEEAEEFRMAVWGVVRPLLLGRPAQAPHVWTT